MNLFRRSPKKLFLALATMTFATMTIASCGGFSSNNDNNALQEEFNNSNSTKFTIVATSELGWTGSGAHSVITHSDPRTVLSDLTVTATNDLAIVGHGKYFYRIERYQRDNITKFSVDAPSVPIWQFSTMEPADILSTNPYTIVFLSDTKAYLLRRDSNKAWIVNPSATTQAGFKIGELDLTQYSPDGGTTPPGMNSGVIVGGKLFISLQRLDMFWSPSYPSYIAVFDTSTDTEIDTGHGSGGLKGIELAVRNPSGRIKYFGGTIYVAGTIYPDNPGWGTTTWTDYNDYSGIQKINVTTYQPNTNLIYKSIKTITYVEIASADKGYFIEYSNAGDTALRSFDPMSGTVNPGNIANIGDSNDRDLADIAMDSDGKLWVADNSLTGAGIYIINTSNDTLSEAPISTGLNPKAITFCEK